MYITTLLLTISCLVARAHAREPIDVSQDVTLKVGASKQEAFDQATENATRKLAEDLVGPDKVGANWAQLKNKLLKNSSRYVLFIRGAAAVDTPDGAKTTVQMRLNPDGLESLLREFGLYNGASVRVLTLVSVSEPQGSRYAWWADAGDGGRANLAQDYFKRVIGQLNAAARGKSIYIMDPLNQGLRAGIPASYRTETLRREDQLLLARYLKADVVLSGRVDVTRAAGGAQLSENFEAWQVRNGRTITESARAEPLPTETPKAVGAMIEQASKRALGELTTKLGEAAAGGALNLNTFKLAVVGALNYPQATELKKVLTEAREVRALRDRLFEPGRVTYEVDSALPGPELARALRGLPARGFAIAITEATDAEVVLTVRPVSPGG